MSYSPDVTPILLGSGYHPKMTFQIDIMVPPQIYPIDSDSATWNWWNFSPFSPQLIVGDTISLAIFCERFSSCLFKHLYMMIQTKSFGITQAAAREGDLDSAERVQRAIAKEVHGDMRGWHVKQRRPGNSHGKSTLELSWNTMTSSWFSRWNTWNWWIICQWRQDFGDF